MTLRELIKGSLRLLNVTAANEEPTADEMNISLEALNLLVDSIGNDILNIYTFQPHRFLLTSGQAEYTLGPALDSSGNLTGANWVIQRPMRIEQAKLLLYPIVTYPTQTTVVASFTASSTSGEAPFTVTFTDTSSGDPTSWLWDFGDSTTSTSQNPSHTFTEPGTYTVTLTASNSSASGSTEATITANEVDPYFSSVILLLHAEEATSGDTLTLTDNSNYGSTKVINSFAALNTSDKKFGSRSIQINDYGWALQSDYTTSEWTLGLFEPMTYECWYKHVSNTTNSQSSPPIFSLLDNAGSVIMYMGHYGATGSNLLQLRFGSAPLFTVTATEGQWNHLAITFDATGFARVWVNGSAQYSTIMTSTTGGTASFRLGSDILMGAEGACEAYLDEVRVTKGVCRYTDTFTPPTRAFPNMGPSV